MNFGLEWLNDVMRWLGRWLPHWDVCEPTHAGVKFRASLIRSGVRTTEIKPGLYWYWPVTTRAYVIPVVRQSVDLPSQSLDTIDGVSMLVSTALVYEVVDVVQALTKNYDVGDTIKEIGAASAVESVVGRKHKDLRDAFADGLIEKELKSAARKLLKPYGIKVIDARFTDCAHHTCIRTEGSANVIPYSEAS